MSKTEKDILDYLTESTAETIAKELIEHVLKFKAFSKLQGEEHEKERNKIGKAECSYDVSGGKVVGEDANTWFQFDLDRETIAYKFLKAMYSRELDDAELNQVNSFIGQVVSSMNEGYMLSMREAVRDSLMPSSNETDIPLENVQVLMVEMVDYSPVPENDRYLLKFAKHPNSTANILAVTDEIRRLRDEGDERPVEEIAKSQIEQNNPVFNGVLDVLRGDKFLWDVELAIFADYSYSDDVIPSAN